MYVYIYLILSCFWGVYVVLFPVFRCSESMSDIFAFLQILYLSAIVPFTRAAVLLSDLLLSSLRALTCPVTCLIFVTV